jgi:hypothetical protein
MKNFQSTLAHCSLEDKVAGLIVFSDTHVNVETMVKLFNIAMEVGIRKVNVASKSGLETGGGVN